MKLKELLLSNFLLVGLILSGQVKDSLNVTSLGHLPYSVILNDIWGYEDGQGNEYALVGTRNSFSVVNVTQPSQPIEVISIPGAFTTWRDIKTWDHYAYVVHDYHTWPSNGITIVDLDSMTNARYKEFFPIVQVDTGNYFFDRAHNIWIDENGILFAFGTNADNKTLMFDLSQDPWNPTYMGYIPGYYHHDGYARNDTLFASAINDGVLAVYDVSLKSNPVFLSQITSPNQFNHNCWLSDDGNYIFTTDEVAAGYIGAFDVSDVMNMKELDRTQKYPGTNVIPHNAHVLGNFLITSYYTAGVVIHDISDPNNLLEVGFYDTSPFQGTGFHGAWGVYPYLSSGNLIVSDMEAGLFILEPDYRPAGRLTIEVHDSLTNALLPQVQVVSVRLSDTLETDLKGITRLATLNMGPEFLILSKQGYYNDTVATSYNSGTNPLIKVALKPLNLGLDEKTLDDLWIENPTTEGVLRIQAPMLLGRNLSIRVSDLAGKVVFQDEVEVVNSLEIPLSISNGVYVVQLQNEAGSYFQRILVQ